MSVRLAASAKWDVRALETYYAERGREAAAAKLIAAVERAAKMIEAASELSLPAPRPYPELADLGARWLHVGRYWFSFVPEAGGFVVTNVIFDTANIPVRIDRGSL